MFLIFAFEVKQAAQLPKQPTRLRVKYAFCCKDENQCREWVRDIRAALRGVVGSDEPVPEYRVLAVVNPFGGRKQAEKVMERVKPIFRVADVKLETVSTEYVGHGVEIGKNLDLRRVDGTRSSSPRLAHPLLPAVVTVSGDGVLNELVNGLLQRDDWQQAASLPVSTTTLPQRDLTLGCCRLGSSQQAQATGWPHRSGRQTPRWRRITW